MSIAETSVTCAFCGKNLFKEKNIVMMADMRWVREQQWGDNTPMQKTCRTKFVAGDKSRNAYCNVMCLKQDLDKFTENSVKISDKTIN